MKLRLIKERGKANLENQGSGNAHRALVTDESGVVTFSGVPKGVKLRAKVINAPKGATRTKENASKNKEEGRDSDLRSDSTSSTFDLGTFEGSTFDTIDLGYRMPVDLKVRLWDDLNANGIQDPEELGIQGVKLQIVKNDKNMTKIASQGPGSTAHQTLVTDEDGFVTFTGVPKGKKYRVKIVNKPVGATVTRKNKGGNKNGADQTDSDLDAKKMASDVFDLASFHGDGECGKIDLGLKLPADVEAKLWEDVNGNGKQDEGKFCTPQLPGFIPPWTANEINLFCFFENRRTWDRWCQG